MLTRVLFLLFILLLLPDAYIYMTYVRKWTTCWWKRTLFFVPSLALLIYLFVVLSQDDFRAVHQPMVGTLMMAVLAAVSTITRSAAETATAPGALLLFAA